MIDYSAVATSIATAVGDVIAGGLILVGGYVGYLGIEKVLDLFSGIKNSAKERQRKVSAANRDFLKAKRDLAKAKRDNSVFSALFSGSSGDSRNGSGRNQKRRQSSRSFSVSFGKFSFSTDPGSGGSRKKAYQEYSGSRVSSRKGGSRRSRRDSYRNFSSKDSYNRSFAPSFSSGNFGPPPDNFGPPPEEYFGPPPEDFGPPPGDRFH